jgi:hypothetical protein
MRCRTRGLVLLAAAGLVAHRTLSAQHIDVSAFGIVAGPRSTVLDQGVREVVGGVWLGAAVQVRRDRWLITASGLRGTLDPIENTPFQSDAGEEGIRVSFALRRRLSVEASYTARAFSSSVGYQRWDMLGLGAAMSVPLGDSALSVDGRVSYLPVASASGRSSPSLAVALEVGVSAAPRGAPVLVHLGYRFERFDFPGEPAEFDRITLEVGYRIR